MCAFVCGYCVAGHARDLQASNAPLALILEMGQWKPPAFFRYLSYSELEKQAVIDAHVGESSDEDN